MALKCFIACGFGHDDIDELYQNAIVPVLRSRSVTPIRIDQIEHNDDIDDRIMKEIRRCNICVADLTYARPSVYYEAGYAAGLSKPVIYTARKDHFSSRIDDPFGNLRVHFDLQMKNIIPWTDSLKPFISRLTRRVDFVARPLLIDLQREQVEKEISARFLAMPDDSKFRKMVDLAIPIVRRAGFAIPEGNIDRMFNVITAARKDGDTLRLIVLVLKASITKTELSKHYKLFSEYRINSLILQYPKFKPKNVIVHVFRGALRSVPATRATEALPHFKPDLNFKRFTYNDCYSDKPHKITDIYLIDGISSIQNFIERFKSLLEFARNTNANRISVE